MAWVPSRLLKNGQTLFQGLLQLIYPRLCWVCQHLQPANELPLCPACVSILGNDPHFTCPRCSSTVGPHIVLSQGCPNCRDSKLHFDRAFRWGPYDGLLREVVLRMKQRQGEGLAEVVGAFWARQLAPQLIPLQPDVVLPVPLHWLNHWQRGFNQSAVLAQALATEIKIPCQTHWVRRVRRTPKQSLQKGLARWENVRQAFAVRPGVNVTGKTILLVDDVLTTGATASETARVLRPLHPRLIVVVVLAHGR
jgi:ComF family protein